jgi:hypothetical protein
MHFLLDLLGFVSYIIYMFIKTVKKKNKYSPKVFEYQHLVESVRTESGVKQKFLLNLGKLNIPQEEWPILAKRIDEIIRGQERIFEGSPEIERLASHYAQKLIRKYEKEYEDSPQKHYEYIDVDSIENELIRTIGAEYISWSYFKKLGLDECLRECGFTKREIEVATLLIIGRMVSPGSERHLHYWAQNQSALCVLLDTDFNELSLNTLYSVCDKIHKNKEYIEKHLREKERDLFGLDEKIILYDLTNTFLEGIARRNPKAKFGRSKDKRSDCRLLTLGLVIDGKGYPKTSRVFKGNQSEPETLLDMINALREDDPTLMDPQNKKLEKPTVVIDAGIATENNLERLKKDYHYICVSRKKIAFPDKDEFIIIKKEDKQNKNRIEAKRIESNGEVFLYCKSTNKKKKEKSMQNRFKQNFEEQLLYIASSIYKKGCTKKYQKVCERVGRLKEKYSRISRFYRIIIEEKDGLASKIAWQYVKDESDKRFSGSYYLRTDRKDLSEKEIWDIYRMLGEVEDTFRTMKSELEIQPNYHQKEDRSETHIYITVFAYHIVHSILTRLKHVNIVNRWVTVRKWLSTHCRVTNQLKNQAGKTIYINKCSKPEDMHKTIYDALNLNYVPCKPKKFITENL